MNTLTLSFFNRSEAKTDKASSDGRYGNVTVTSYEITKTRRDFYEFYVDEQPLSKILEDYFTRTTPVLENWVGMLGSFSNKEAEKVRIKRLLRENIEEADLIKVFPASFSERQLHGYLDAYKMEVANEWVLIYGCAECGDPHCGGIRAKVSKDTTSYTWDFKGKNKTLQFRFDQWAYYSVFDNYRQMLNGTTPTNPLP